MPPDATPFKPEPRWTVGSLYGLPEGAVPTGPRGAPAAGPAGIPPGAQDGRWAVRAGQPTDTMAEGIDATGVERLDYNNPFGQTVERVWFDRRLVFALDVGEIELPSADGVKVAQEYQIVYDVELDERGKLVRKELVPGQYNIYDSIPGMAQYSPIWQFNYVVVPRDYQPQRLRSEEDCLNSGYPIHRSQVFEN
jgi:hypothetical protein